MTSRAQRSMAARGGGPAPHAGGSQGPGRGWRRAWRAVPLLLRTFQAATALTPWVPRAPAPPPPPASGLPASGLPSARCSCSFWNVPSAFWPPVLGCPLLPEPPSPSSPPGPSGSLRPTLGSGLAPTLPRKRSATVPMRYGAWRDCPSLFRVPGALTF